MYSKSVYIPKCITDNAVIAGFEAKDNFDPQAALADDSTQQADAEAGVAAPTSTANTAASSTDANLNTNQNTDTAPLLNNNIATQADDGEPANDPAIPFEQSTKGAAEALYRRGVLRLCVALVNEPGEFDSKQIDTLKFWVENWLYLTPIEQTISRMKALGLANALKPLLPTPPKETV
jgi:hypothetical protein